MFNRKLKFFLTVLNRPTIKGVWSYGKGGDWERERAEASTTIYIYKWGRNEKKETLLTPGFFTDHPTSLVSVSVSVTGTEVFLSMPSPMWLVLSFVCTGLHLSSVYSTYYSAYWHHFRGCYRLPCFTAYNRFSMGYLRPGECSVIFLLAHQPLFSELQRNRKA